MQSWRIATLQYIEIIMLLKALVKVLMKTKLFHSCFVIEEIYYKETILFSIRIAAKENMYHKII